MSEANVEALKRLVDDALAEKQAAEAERAEWHAKFDAEMDHRIRSEARAFRAEEKVARLEQLIDGAEFRRRESVTIREVREVIR